MVLLLRRFMWRVLLLLMLLGVIVILLVLRTIDPHGVLILHVGFSHVVLLFAFLVFLVSEFCILVFEFVNVLHLLGGLLHKLQIFKCYLLLNIFMIINEGCVFII